jgi:hypothetical protein
VKFDALRTFPDLSGHRYGTLSLGYDRLTTISDQFRVLLAGSAAIIGRNPDDLTHDDVRRLTTRLSALGREPLATRIDAAQSRLDQLVERLGATGVDGTTRELALDAALWVLSLGR